MTDGRKVLLFLIPSLIVYFLMLFMTIPSVQSYANGMKIFDLLPTGYSYQYAVELLSMLGEDGRAQYLTVQLPLDFVYPVLFSISSFLLLAWILGKRPTNNAWIYYLCVVPVFAGAFDYLENIQVIRMLLSFPDMTELQVKLASGFTVSKSVLTTVFFISLLFSLLRLAAVSNSKGQ